MLITHISEYDIFVHMKILGYDSKLYWNDGQIRLDFIGEKCNKEADKNYTLTVLLHCDYAETKNDFLGVFHDDNQCEITILLRTPKACFEIPENVRNAKMFATTSTKKLLNFNALKSSNHVINDPVKGTFIFGFPIVYEHNALCEGGTSICHVNNSETDLGKKYTNLGMMTSNIVFINDRPVIKLTNSNLKCNETHKLSSEIVFECDQFAGEGTPKYKGTKDCVNHFTWNTNLACAAEDKPCVMSGKNGEMYDFSSLANVQYSVVHPNKTDEIVYFSICSKSKECGDGEWGSCIVKMSKELSGSKQVTNAGNFNSKLQLENKNVFLKYDGSRCNAEGKRYSTKIEFSVADDQQDESAVLIEDDCDIVIHFKTLLANHNVKNCVVKDRDDVEMDLRPLINYEGNYLATVNVKNLPKETHSTYLLNVCRPLNSFYSLNCHGNTGACKSIVSDGKHEEELSLGHFEYFMTTAKGEKGITNVIMKYFQGSKCPTEEADNITTKVTFFCDESAGIGNPILQSTFNCEYSFDFPTSVLCADQTLSLKANDSCVIYNEKLNTSVDLKQFGNFNTSNILTFIRKNINN